MTRRTLHRRLLKELREDAGLTHRTLAARIAADGRPCSASYLWKLENWPEAADSVSPVYLKRLADALGVPLDVISIRVPIEDAA